MDMTWRNQAACLVEDPELFFPVAREGKRNRDQEAEAKAVCRRCPVARQCLKWALDTGQAHGVWGGATEQERRDMLRLPTRREVAA